MKISVISIGITGILLVCADFYLGSGDNIYVISMLAVLGVWMVKDDKREKSE